MRRGYLVKSTQLKQHFATQATELKLDGLPTTEKTGLTALDKAFVVFTLFFSDPRMMVLTVKMVGLCLALSLPMMGSCPFLRARARRPDGTGVWTLAAVKKSNSNTPGDGHDSLKSIAEERREEMGGVLSSKMSESIASLDIQEMSPESKKHLKSNLKKHLAEMLP